MPHARHCPLMVLLAALIGALALCSTARAQGCTSDAQCSPFAGGINQCLGDTLILRRSICVAGHCQVTETGRQNCNIGGGAGTCQGNTFVRSGGRCDAPMGRCSTGGTSQIACVKTCSCRGNRLVIATGVCSPGAGCGQAAFQCKKGCTCSPEARCLEDREPRVKGRPAPRPRQN